MKILWIGGNHPRHLYFINKLQTKFQISGAIIQKRENVIPKPSENIEEVDKVNFVKHFSNRYLTEKKFFGNPSLPKSKILKVTSLTLNSQKSVDFVNSINPDIVIIFGSDLIKDPLLSCLPKQTINLHLGLSPRYRGAATLFWPFYFLEPNYVGSTFHYIVSEPDAGDIIHQCVPTLDKDDKIHDVACKTVIVSSDEIHSRSLRILPSQDAVMREAGGGGGVIVVVAIFFSRYFYAARTILIQNGSASRRGKQWQTGIAGLF